MNHPRILPSQSGLSKLTVIIFSTLIGVVVYCTYEILPFYYYYYELENQVVSITRVASTIPDKEIRRRLMYHIKKMGIPLEPEEIHIARQNNRIQISFEYSEVFSIEWDGEEKEIHTFDFQIYVDENYWFFNTSGT